jgi:hypothetical protein
MVVSWDGKHTLPCCQGFTLQIDGGAVVPSESEPALSLKEVWASANFDRLRASHRDRTWDRLVPDGEPICQGCAVTKTTAKIETFSV